MQGSLLSADPEEEGRVRPSPRGSNFLGRLFGKNNSGPRDDITLGAVWSEQLHRTSTTIVAVALEQGPMRTQQALHIHIEGIGTRRTHRYHSLQTGPLAELSIFECVG